MNISIVDAINMGAARSRSLGMSDEQRDNEYGAQHRLARAVHEMHEAISLVNQASAVVSIRAQAFADFIHDELPGEAFWDARIAKARNP